MIIDILTNMKFKMSSLFHQSNFTSISFTGNILRWEQQCRFKHMTTRKYMTIDAKGVVDLTKDHNDPKTVFRLHPVIKVKICILADDLIITVIILVFHSNFIFDLYHYLLISKLPDTPK